jgi:hypothetical protein
VLLSQKYKVSEVLTSGLTGNKTHARYLLMNEKKDDKEISQLLYILGILVVIFTGTKKKDSYNNSLLSSSLLNSDFYIM